MKKRVLSIAGFDPSGGAGILADIKTFQAFGVYGYACTTAITYQNSDTIFGIDWVGAYEIIKQLDALAKDKNEAQARLVKIGIVENMNVLLDILDYLSYKTDFVIYDPIITASSGYKFWQDNDREKLIEILKKVHLITPNLVEYKAINKILKEGKNGAEKFTNVLVKSASIGKDLLYIDGGVIELADELAGTHLPAKHGSGCVLSSAILANIALGNDVVESCKIAKKYLNDFLSSESGLLGRHYEV